MVDDIEAVFAVDDESTLALACSLLNGARIKYFVEGSALKNAGVLAGYNSLINSMRIMVAQHDADAARAILHQLDQQETGDPNEEDVLEECIHVPGMSPALKRIIVVSIIVVAALAVIGIIDYMGQY